MRILLVEDEESIRKLIHYDLKQAGFQVDECIDGLEGFQKGTTEKYDLMILDWMIPYKSGLELVKEFRKNKIDSIIIMLTAKDDEHDILEAFEAGVDDYVTKPFSPRQLVARILAHTKRRNVETEKKMIVGNLEVDFNLRKVFVENSEIELTKKEFELLKYLITNRHLVLTRDQILNEIWNFDYDGDTRIVDVHIFKLRSKLSSSNVSIKSMRGVGYRLESIHEEK